MGRGRILEGLTLHFAFRSEPLPESSVCSGQPCSQLSAVDKKIRLPYFGVNSKLPYNIRALLASPPITSSPSTGLAIHPDPLCYHTNIYVVHPVFFVHTAAAVTVNISSRDGSGTACPQEGSPRALTVCVWFGGRGK